MAIKHLTQTPPSHLFAPSSSSIATPAETGGRPRIPSIRLISATPSATGLSSSEGSNASMRIFDDSIGASSSPTPWDSMPPPPVPSLPAQPLKKSTSRLLPKTSAIKLSSTSSSAAGATTAKRLIPKKKSKLGLLSGSNSGGGDFSDVVRRVTAHNASSQASLVGSTKLKGGYEIYVDGDPDMSDILVVKKQKSRAGLDGVGVGWGPKSASNGVLGEVDRNVNAGGKKDGLLKVKVDEERKWWSIGRGRKDSKEDKVKVKEQKDKENAPVQPPRSQTPDPFKSSKATSQTDQPSSRTRFNSLDAGLLLGLGKKKSKDVLSSIAPPTVRIAEPAPASVRRSSDSQTNTISTSNSNSKDKSTNAKGTATYNQGLNTKKYPSALGIFPQGQPTKMERIPTPPQGSLGSSSTISAGSAPAAKRSATPTFGGLLAPPPSGGSYHGVQTGGLAVPGATNNNKEGSIALRAMRSVRSIARIGSWGVQGSGSEKEKEASTGTLTKKDKDKKEKKPKKSLTGTIKSVKGGAKKERGSTSSFEAGALSSSSPPHLVNPVGSVGKKRSILGMGLPSSMRLPNVNRQGSSASSVLAPPASSSAFTNNNNNNNANGNGNNGTIGSSFSAFSNAPAATVNGRLSVDSAIAMGASHRDPSNGRRGSVQSTQSSLRPVSITSTISGTSTGGSSRISSGGFSSGSVRWDEEGLERVKAERESKRESKESVIAPVGGGENGEKAKKRTSRESTRRGSEARRRTPITDVFPEIVGASRPVSSASSRSASSSSSSTQEDHKAGVREGMFPIVTIEEATADGHGEDLDALIDDDESEKGVVEGSTGSVAATPVKKPRARPLSEQLLGRSRPAAMHEDEDGVLSILSAATNDLAQLINNLDLEATPCTPDMTPLKPSPSPFNSEPANSATSISRSMSLDYTESPLKNRKKVLSPSAATVKSSPVQSSTSSSPATNKGVTVRSSVASISSLRPYAQSRLGGGRSQTVRTKPSAEVMYGVGPIPSWPLPEKVSLADLRAALRPAKASSESARVALASVAPLKVGEKKGSSTLRAISTAAKTSSGATVRARVSPARVRDAFDNGASESEEDEERYKTVRGVGALLKPSESTFGTPGSKSSHARPSSKRQQEEAQVPAVVQENRAPISKEARRILGMSGTMGGSDVSAYRVELDESDPDSDVPEELRVILQKDEADTISYQSQHHDNSDSEDDNEDDSSFTGRHGYVLDDDEDLTMDMIEVPRSIARHQHIPSSHHFGLSTSSRMSDIEIQHAHRLPVFRAQLVTDTTSHDADMDSDNLTSSYSDENSTKLSFDFTGELAKLNESGASDRRSFVEQLENAFKTPAKVDLRADFGILAVDLPPPVPALPDLASFGIDTTAGATRGSVSVSSSSIEAASSSGVEVEVSSFFGSEVSVGVGRDAANGVEAESVLVEMNQPTFFCDSEQASSDQQQVSSSFDAGDSVVSRILGTKQPSLELPSLKSSTNSARSTRSSTSVSAKLKLKASTSSAKSNGTSDGELNRSFRFGGSPSPPKVPESPRDEEDSLFDDSRVSMSQEGSEKPLTLTDIIPPPSFAQEFSFSSSMLDAYEDSALQSLMGRAIEVPQQQPPQQPQSQEDSQEYLEQARKRTISGASQNNRISRRLSNFIPLTRPSSGVSFGGLDSFDEVRRGFEFHDYRPDFYVPEQAAPSAALAAAALHANYRNKSHRRAQDSVFSIASVSSYGRVIRDGANDPFDFGMMPPVPPVPAHLRGEQMMPSVREQSYEEDMSDSMSIEMSTQVDDTFSFLNHRPVQPRRRVDSDASSFYFTAPPPAQGLPARGHGHRRRESSNWSVSSMGGAAPPPVSMYNRSFGGGGGHHRRTSSVTSASSVALSYAHGGIGGRAIMARHRREASFDSVNSESYSRGLGRPGLGEKMFDMEYAGPLSAIAGSPSVSMSEQMEGFLSGGGGANNRTSSSSSFEYYDSILDNEDAYAYRFERQRDSIAEEEYGYEDEDERRSSVADSLFDQTGEGNRSSVSSGSLFGADDSQPMHGGLLPHFRPPSVISLVGSHSPMKEDDTMISMLGGGHVRRRSIGSMIDASPCVRMEKRHNHRRTARMVYQGVQLVRTDMQGNVVASPAGKAKTLDLKPSIASTSSFQFGGDRMIKARHGLLERQSLEEGVLMAEGEDLSQTFQVVPVFTRPQPTTRSRSSTCTSASESSGRDTPPLSPSDGSSFSGGSFSSVDMADMDVMLSNTTHPVSTIASARARARDHGHGHRRRYSKAHISRSSVYETIEEELSSAPSSPAQSVYGSATKKLGAVGEDSTAVYVVGSDTESIHNAEEGVWDDERGILALRKFYHLKDEAQSTVMESQRTWRDTPFSLYAVQSFDPPRNPDGMKALLEHSMHNYTTLPSELRRMRSRKNSRPSPYPQTRYMPATMASPAFERAPQPAKQADTFESHANEAATPVLKDKKLNRNLKAPSLEAVKPLSPFVLNISEHGVKKDVAAASQKGSNGIVRPRVPSAARRSALGWSKRSNGAKSSTDKKENAVGEGSVMTPGESLRLNRPRPRGRTPASQARPIRV